MKSKKQKPDFLHLGEKLLHWYKEHSRDLPWRKTKEAYKIWICEILLQQTQVKQGLNHYLKFIERFPSVNDLAQASEDEILLYWKGLGYYSRALNLHQAAKEIFENHGGIFPKKHADILKLKGVGNYTAAAISSIAFNEKFPAVDGNFYRVLSRLFADDFDISKSSAFNYFSELALRMMPEQEPGDFNEAMMDLGSEICKPKNPLCPTCPLNTDCLALQTGKVQNFPVKTKRAKVSDLELTYFFIIYNDQFLAKARGGDFIWKKLYEFPTKLPVNMKPFLRRETIVKHKLTHKNLSISISEIMLEDESVFRNFAFKNNFEIFDFVSHHEKSFPKPLQNYLENYQKKGFEIGHLF